MSNKKKYVINTKKTIYKNNHIKQYNEKTSLQLIIFDMDHTLWHETLFDQIDNILLELHERGINLAIASFNPLAEFLCDRYDIKKYFDIICGYYNKNGKLSHINTILNHYHKNDIKIISSNVLFVDDNELILNQIKKHTTIQCLKVNPDIGVEYIQLSKYL